MLLVISHNFKLRLKKGLNPGYVLHGGLFIHNPWLHHFKIYNFNNI